MSRPQTLNSEPKMDNCFQSVWQLNDSKCSYLRWKLFLWKLFRQPVCGFAPTYCRTIWGYIQTRFWSLCPWSCFRTVPSGPLSAHYPLLHDRFTATSAVPLVKLLARSSPPSWKRLVSSRSVAALLTASVCRQWGLHWHPSQERRTEFPSCPSLQSKLLAFARTDLANELYQAIEFSNYEHVHSCLARNAATSHKDLLRCMLPWRTAHHHWSQKLCFGLERMWTVPTHVDLHPYT